MGSVSASMVVRVGSPALGGDRPIQTTTSTRDFRAERTSGVGNANFGFWNLTLYTLAPAPAATIAEVVLTLKVSWPSPPVPTISTTLRDRLLPSSSISSAPSPRLTIAGKQCFLSTDAAPARTSGFLSSPFKCIAVRKLPICAGWALAGSSRCSSAACASSRVKVSGAAIAFCKINLKLSGVLMGSAINSLRISQRKGGVWTEFKAR
jgi:hypothetical protein